MMDNAERLTGVISKYLEIGDSDFYICTRDKSAFSAGTMKLDDFVEVDEDIASDMANWLEKNGVILPPCKPGDKVYFVIDDNISGEIYVSVEIITDVSTKGFFLNGDYTLYPYDEIGKCDMFLSEEEAENVAEKWRNKDNA